MNEEFQKSLDELILQGTSPREMRKFVIARFAASTIIEAYANFCKETACAVKGEQQFVDYHYGHAACIASLINAVARGNGEIAIAIAKLVVLHLQAQYDE